MNLTIEEVRQEVANIEESKGDSEIAHEFEDTLYRKFIEHVAENGNKKLSEMAKECLKTQKIEFARYTA